MGKTNIALPGIGSWIAVAIAQKNLPAIFEAILAMLVVILIYDQLLFRPLVAWADRFRVDSEQSEEAPQSWALTVYRRSRLLDLMTAPFEQMMRWSYHWHPPSFGLQRRRPRSRQPRRRHHLVRAAGRCWGFWRLAHLRSSSHANLSWSDLATAVGLGFITLMRVMVLIALASLIWTPIGIYVGLRPKLTADRAAGGAVPGRLSQQSAVPAGGVADRVLERQSRHLAVAADRPGHPMVHPVQCHRRRQPPCRKELRDAAENFGVHGWLWWRKVALPAVFPFYVTGAITASGGAWNASVLAEVASWGKTTLHAHGLGAYIADAIDGGRFPPRRAGHRGDELFCGGGEPAVVAAALLVRRTQIPANVRSPCNADLLNVEHVRRTFPRGGGEELLVLDDVNLTLKQGEIVGLLGRSGSGKSTLLRLIAGLAQPQGGSLTYMGAPIEGPAQGVAMVFQSFALFPWLTVLENVQLGLEALNLPPRGDARNARWPPST